MIDAQRSGKPAMGTPYRGYVPAAFLQLWYLSIAPGTVHVTSGDLFIDGRDTIAIAQTDVVLTGNPEYIYVQHAWDGSTATVEHSTTKPQSNATYYRHTLFKFVPTGGVYSLSEILHPGGAIHISVALR